jgi:DNA-binding transcriptional regulator YdaS (Cro superfamily)
MAGAELAVWALRQGIALKQVARLIGVSQSCVSLWKHGRLLPKAQHRIAIAKLTNGTIPVELWDQPRLAA